MRRLHPSTFAFLVSPNLLLCDFLLSGPLICQFSGFPFSSARIVKLFVLAYLFSLMRRLFFRSILACVSTAVPYAARATGTCWALVGINAFNYRLVGSHVFHGFQLCRFGRMPKTFVFE